MWERERQWPFLEAEKGKEIFSLQGFRKCRPQWCLFFDQVRPIPDCKRAYLYHRTYHPLDSYYGSCSELIATITMQIHTPALGPLTSQQMAPSSSSYGARTFRAVQMFLVPTAHLSARLSALSAAYILPPKTSHSRHCVVSSTGHHSFQLQLLFRFLFNFRIILYLSLPEHQWIFLKRKSFNAIPPSKSPQGLLFILDTMQDMIITGALPTLSSTCHIHRLARC